MKDERRYTILIDEAYRSTALVWWILEVDMANAVHLGFGVYKARVANLVSRDRTEYVCPMTREQVYTFIQERMRQGDWADILFLDGTKFRDVQRHIRAYVKGEVAL